MRSLAALALVAACGGTAAAPPAEELPEPPIPQSPAGKDREAMTRETELVEDLSKRGCACRDAACFEGIDGELRSYFRETATLNDPITDVESWPVDLDARARRAYIHLFRCMQGASFESYAYGVLFARIAEQFRAVSCACADADCARVARARFDEVAEEFETTPADAVTLEEIRTTVSAMKECLDRYVPDAVQQAVLDLKVLRRDACACSDAACAAPIEARFDEWLAAHENTKGSPQVTEVVREVAEELWACLRAANGGEP